MITNISRRQTIINEAKIIRLLELEIADLRFQLKLCARGSEESVQNEREWQLAQNEKARQMYQSELRELRTAQYHAEPRAERFEKLENGYW